MAATVDILIKLDGVQYTNETGLQTVSSLLDRSGVNFKKVALVVNSEDVATVTGAEEPEAAPTDNVRRKKTTGRKKTVAKKTVAKKTAARRKKTTARRRAR